MHHSDLDPSYALPHHLYYQVVHALRLALPPPASDAPHDLLTRDHAAIAQVGSMLPANGEEAMLAAQFVAASSHALDCLRLVRQHPTDISLGLKCTAQAASMMRQANAARSLLLRVQAQRQKRDAHTETCDAAAQIEHCAVGLMLNALDAMPAPPPPAPLRPAHDARPAGTPPRAPSPPASAPAPAPQRSPAGDPTHRAATPPAATHPAATPPAPTPEASAHPAATPQAPAPAAHDTSGGAGPVANPRHGPIPARPRALAEPAARQPGAAPSRPGCATPREHRGAGVPDTEAA